MDTAVGRQRSPRFRGLPTNLHPDPKRDTIYYRYKMPDGTYQPMGRNKADAIAAANALNLHFSSPANSLFNRALSTKPTWRDPLLTTLIDDYEAHMVGQRLAAGTIKEKAIKLREYKRTWPQKTVQALATIDISEFLSEKAHHAYGKHRVLLCDLFQYACHKGYRDDNPARRTLENNGRSPKKIRQRHTWEGYQATYAAADAWLQRAMALALYSIQRRQDLVALHRDKLDLKRRTLSVFQQKSANYKNPVYIGIEMGDELLAVVQACIASDVPCPYLIHRRPGRIKTKDREAKPHPFAVLPLYLSRAFSAARDKAGAYGDMAAAERPTFHELRAFGIHLYREAGFSDEYIMALSGHAGSEMIDYYDADHADKKPVTVKAGLTLRDPS